MEVENALLKRALGYEYQEERIEVSEKDGKRIIQTIKHVVPDTTAQIYWLKNRRPDKWRDKPAPDTQDSADQHRVLMEALKEAVKDED